MARRIVSFLKLALPILLVPGLLPGQVELPRPGIMDLGLEDLMKVEIDSVFGASGYKQYVSDVPASITIVTASEIQRYGYRTLADILRNVPGFSVTSDRVSTLVGVRGFGRPGDYNSRVLLLVDGHRMHDPVSGGSSYGMDFPVDIDLIDRVEVIRGPNSSVYIASALLGVINVVTRRAHDAPGLSASGQLAGNGVHGARLTYGHHFDSGLEILLSGSYFGSHGAHRLYYREYDSPATNFGMAENVDSSQSYNQFAKVSYRGFTMEAAYGSSEQGDPTAAYGTIFNDPGERIRFKAGYFDLSYEHHFGSDWGYMCRLYYDNDQYHGSYPFDESPLGGPSRLMNQDVSGGQNVGASFALSKKLPGGQTVTVGSEYRYNFQQDQSNYNTQPYLLQFQSRRRSNLWGVHVQDEIPIRKNLVLNLGLSYDRYSTFGGTVNPRAGLIYQPFEGTSLKFLFGQSFRAPTAFELYYSVPGQDANPHLKPETTKTMEVVLEQSLANRFRLVASGYYYPVRGLISVGTDPASGVIIYQNSQRVDLKGVEVAIKRQSRFGWEAGLSMGLQDARDLDNSGPLTNSPRVLGQASLSVPFFRGKLFASTNLQYVGKRKTLAGDFAEAYIVPNVTLFSQKALWGWEASASLYNAFDQTYYDPASVAHLQHVLSQEGRTFRLKFTYHF